jgi:5'-deoxynucleotidase YfbR-like HD superfamily hydrolase
VEKLTAVKRDILLTPMHWENDSEHTLQTALMTWRVAKQYAPEIDAGEVLKMALVHELAETITGDYSSYLMTADELEAKRLRDAKAAKQIVKNYQDCPNLVDNFLKYEAKMSCEARFVYWLDKIEPLFPKYSPAFVAHWLAPIDKVYEYGGTAHGGLNGNLTNIVEWYDRIRVKLLRAGAVPHPICENLLAQNFAWLKWFVDNHEWIEI